jgi:molybdate transport system ATP-binding protein
MLEVVFRHRFDESVLDVAFAAPTPGTTVLFGASGAGKSTIVSVIAGLLRPAEGRVVVDGEALWDSERRIWLPPERRGLGVVFQDARLFPHLSVAGNLRYGLRRARLNGPASRTIGFDDVVMLLGLSHLLARQPHTLSGGERQRAAIGRALLAQPRLLVMDEPLASLDAARKSEILPYLGRLKASLTLPVVYVTHSLEEVARLADTLVLIESGRVVAAGPLAEIASRADLPLAARDDAAAVFAATVDEHDVSRRLTRLRVGRVTLLAPLLDRPRGKALRLRMPTRDVMLATAIPEEISVQNVLTGKVRAVVAAGIQTALVEVAVDDLVMLARVTPDAVERLRLGSGTPVIALIKSTSIEVLADSDAGP